MKTFFQMGLNHSGLFGVKLRSNARWLGQQAPSSGLSRNDRDAYVSQMQAAMDKMNVVNTFSEAHPNPTVADLGSDLQAYNAQMNNLGAFASQAATAYQAMAYEQQSYDVAATDLNAIPGWIAAVNALYDIVQRHQGKPGTAPGVPGTPGARSGMPPPGTPAASAGPSPALIGGLAVAGIVAAVFVLKG